jgi:hypothetical protein
MIPRLFIFQCSNETYLSCMEKGLFGSNLPWPLEVRKDDYCLLHHFEAGTLLGLWQAVGDGGKKLDSRAWNGKFPYQVKIRLVGAKVTEVTGPALAALQVDPRMGRFDPVVDEEVARLVLDGMNVVKQNP